MLRKAQIHMLSTDKKAPEVGMITTTKDGKLQMADKSLVEIYKMHQEFGDFSPAIPFQYLYFTSDEEIKESDWIIIADKHLRKVVKGSNATYVVVRTDNAVFRANCRKIVATTNPELWSKTPIEGQEGHFLNMPIPIIGTDFVERFVKDFNEGKPIKEVMLEYEIRWRGHKDVNLGSDEILKLRTNGTVIIHPIVEKTYTLQEVSDLLENNAYDMYLNYLIDKNKCTDKTSKNYLSFKDWFTQYYPQ